MRPIVRPATPADALYIAPRLREEDRRECRAASGRPPLEGILAGVAAGRCFVADAGGGPFLIGGVGPAAPRVGAIWLVGTPAMERHKVFMARRGPEWVEEFHREFPALVNVTDARNELHHRFIRWCGFTFLKLRPYGPFGLPFYEFARCVTQ